MSDTMQTPPTPASVFQAHFGAPPGAQDPRADCEKWERLCGELLAERAKLREELLRARFVEFCKEPFPLLTRDELEAQIDREGTIDEIIADLKKELRAGQ
jgi:hypothetical protein